jgi:hypothetical protein
MPIVFLFNCVKEDGKGDFSHFSDIYIGLKNDPKLQNFELIPVVNCTTHTKQIFENKLIALGVKKFFLCNEDDPLYEDHNLQEDLAKAIQIIQISYDSFPFIEKYRQYFNQNAIFKFIGEHENTDPFTSGLVSEKALIRSLGLSSKAYGLKLTSITDSKLKDFTLDENDRKFIERLLYCSKTGSIEEFNKSNFLVPAYFSKLVNFMRFLLLVSTNEKLSETDIAIYLSGKCSQVQQLLDNVLTDKRELAERTFYTRSNIKQIELIHSSSQDSSVFPININGTKIIRIFAGYQLSDNFYRALYQNALLAGVSGDNTLETAISCKVVPYYWSTNSGTKKSTLKALHKIISAKLEKMDVTEHVKTDLLLFFNIDEFEKFVMSSRNFTCTEEVVKKFQKIDLIAIASVWQEIATHLIQEYNFYNKLTDIFLERLDTSLLNTNSESKTAETGEYSYSQITVWFKPSDNNEDEMDITRSPKRKYLDIG